MTSAILDLDAVAREGRGEAPTLRFGGRDYTLPVEFPVDVLEPLLDESLDLPGVLMALVDTVDDDDETTGRVVLAVLRQRPTLLFAAIGALNESMRRLFGEEQWSAFTAARPGVAHYVALARWLWSTYGLSLGEAFGSSAPSTDAGATSSPTSNASTESTHDGSGDTPPTPSS